MHYQINKTDMENTNYSLTNARSCDTFYQGMYTGKHWEGEDQHFNFSTPNSFLNHFDAKNPLYWCQDLIINYSWYNENVCLTVQLKNMKTNEKQVISVHAPTIPAAFVQLLIKMDI